MSQDIAPLNELDLVRRVEHRIGSEVTHSIVTHIERGALIKCMTCREPLPKANFYTCKTGRASPHCIACNADAALKAKYARELRSEGIQGFQKRITRKEHQLNLMLKAVIEFQKQDGKVK